MAVPILISPNLNLNNVWAVWDYARTVPAMSTVLPATHLSFTSSAPPITSDSASPPAQPPISYPTTPASPALPPARPVPIALPVSPAKTVSFNSQVNAFPPVQLACTQPEEFVPTAPSPVPTAPTPIPAPVALHPTS